MLDLIQELDSLIKATIAGGGKYPFIHDFIMNKGVQSLDKK
jgi:C-terminus of histone H2A